MRSFALAISSLSHSVFPCIRLSIPSTFTSKNAISWLALMPSMKNGVLPPDAFHPSIHPSVFTPSTSISQEYPSTPFSLPLTEQTLLNNKKCSSPSFFAAFPHINHYRLGPALLTRHFFFCLFTHLTSSLSPTLVSFIAFQEKWNLQSEPSNRFCIFCPFC